MNTETIEPKYIDLVIRVKDSSESIDGKLRYQYDTGSGKLVASRTFESGQTLIAAYYDANGQMIQVQTQDKADDLMLNPSSAKIKLFLLDKDSKPVCPAVTVKG